VLDDELDELWHQWKSSGSPVARERLILHYAPLVMDVASRVATGLPVSVEQVDLVSYGIFGLMDALGKFEPGRGNKFETYAIPRIKDAIIHDLRVMDRVPRSVRFKARELETAHTNLESLLKRQPSEKEMAERLGISVRELHQMVNRIVETVSIPETLADTILDPSSSRTSGTEGQEIRGMLAAAVNSLPERDKIVVTLYFFEGLTLAEIGDVLGVTESRVSQIVSRILDDMRGAMQESRVSRGKRRRQGRPQGRREIRREIRRQRRRRRLRERLRRERPR
jgi:RNA polymerase sigma factor FliA